jgi:hypothetical protein
MLYVGPFVFIISIITIIKNFILIIEVPYIN